MKLTTAGVNFINIYARLLCQYFCAKKLQSQSAAAYRGWGKRVGRRLPVKIAVKFILIVQGWPDFFDRGPNLKTIFLRGPHYWK